MDIQVEVEAEALLDALGDTLGEIKAGFFFCETVADVEAEKHDALQPT